MKKIILLLLASLLYASTFADNEVLSVLREDGVGNQYWEYGNFGAGRCSPHNFRVQYTIPGGFASVKQFDWYVDDVFIKTTTATAQIGGVWYGVTELIVDNPEAKFVCKVIYQTSNNVPSGPFPSSAFLIFSDILGFIMNGPTSVNIGSQTVSYSLTPNGGLGTYVPPAGSYTVTWSGPAGWTLGSVTNGGLNAPFTTDNASGGVVKATVTLNGGCGYHDAKERTITRIYPAPTFSSPDPSQVCSSSPSGTYTVNPQSLAVSYTYAIHPYNGSGANITFAANGQQTLTTTATSVTVNFNTQEDQIIFLGVVANYLNGSSSEANLQIIYIATVNWSGDISWEPECMQACNSNTPVDFHATATYIPGATYYWYMDDFLVDIGVGNTTSLTWHGESMLQVKAVTACASTDLYSEAFPISCDCNFARSADNGLSIYPNPAQNELSVSLNAVNAKDKRSKLKDIRVIRILDKLGAIKKYNKYPAGTQTANLNIGSLPADIYIIEISNGVNKINKQLIKIR